MPSTSQAIFTESMKMTQKSKSCKPFHEKKNKEMIMWPSKTNVKSNLIKFNIKKKKDQLSLM